MARAPFQILVFPFLKTNGNTIKYAVFQRRDLPGSWQAIAGGGEDNETPEEAARRELYEESGIEISGDLIKLDSMAMIPVVHICGFQWGPDVLTIPEYCFAVEVLNRNIKISGEHTEFEWLNYTEAAKRLTWDSNKNALWELNYRLTGNPA